MKLILVLVLCAMVASAAKVQKVDKLNHFETNDDGLPETVESRNILVNALVRQLIAYIRRVINNGSIIFGIPPLDPLELESYNIFVPAEIVNLNLQLEKIFATGMGGFVVHRSNLNLSELSFDLDISVPRLNVSAGTYNFTGDFLNAIPLYGQGRALFLMEQFRFQAKLFLMQSEDEKSVLIERIENASFRVPDFKSDLDGAIGGGDIDAIVNAMIENVIVDYVNRFQGPISSAASDVIVKGLNPILDQLDTWRYISVLLPRPRIL